jgi:hypothetical protein
MATATFYQNLSDDRKLDKKLRMLRGNPIHIDFKQPTSVINPIITVVNFDGVFSCNYVYINDFNRYYYIRTMTVGEQSISMQLEVDVLGTYKNQIRDQKVIVKRQQSKKLANFYLDDDKYKALEYSRIQCKAFSGGFTTNAFILTVAGGR